MRLLLWPLIASVLVLGFFLTRWLDGGPGRAPAGPAPEASNAGTREPAELAAVAPLPDERAVQDSRQVVVDQESVAPANAPSSELYVTLFDRLTGRPVASDVELWQLGLPETEIWTAGDRLHAAEHVPASGRLFRHLRPGEYRVFARARLLAAVDPPAFAVREGSDSVELLIDLPTTARIHLELRDPDGNFVRSARYRRSMLSVEKPKAPFATPRRKKVGDILIGGGGAGGGFRSRSMRAGRLGFALGVFRERDCTDAYSYKFHLRADRAEYVRFEPPGFELDQEAEDADHLPDVVFVAVAVPSDWFDEAIRLPNGYPAREEGATIVIESGALRREPGTPVDLWNLVPIRVEVTLDGYEPLEFTTTLADGPPRLRTLTPK